MVARWQLGGKIPTMLVAAASVAAVLLTAAVLFGTRWTPSSDAQTWVSAGVRVVMSASMLSHSSVTIVVNLLSLLVMIMIDSFFVRGSV
jgi:ABC-type multidrug transport system permease subunit